MNPPLLFIHGFGADSRIWNAQRAAFSEERSSFALNLDLSSVDLAARRVAAFVENKKLKNPILIGWSLGAWVAIKAHLKYLKNTHSLILVSATPKFIKAGDFPHGLSPALFRNLQRKLKSDHAQGMIFFHRLIFNFERDTDSIEGLVVPEESEILGALHELQKGDLRKFLPLIKIPTLLIHGKRDQICPPEAARYMKDKIADPVLEIFENSSHAPFIEEPERFNRRLKEYAG